MSDHIISQQEKTYLLETLNDTKADYPKDKTIVDLFEEQVSKTPNAIAIKFKETELTYQELNEKSNQLAHYLLSNYNIQADDLVGIELERSEWMVIGILAIIKSGGAYVPIDPEYPQQRKAFIKEDASLKLIINEEELSKFRQENKKQVHPKSNPRTNLNPTNLMYVIYTSGSTGNPKGCMLEHGGLVNRLTTIWNTLGFGEDEVILQSTTSTFDVSLTELIMPLIWGSKTILLSKNDLLNFHELSENIRKNLVTSIHAVPGLLSLLIENSVYRKDNFRNLRRVVSAGEPLSVSLLQEWHNKTDVSLFNYYGPTETSIYVLGYKTNSIDTAIHIGKSLPNTKTYLLDTTHSLVPYGSIGEICIGGVGLARGYLNREELTKEKFITNPYKSEERIYRTGDLGRWREDGNLEYLGRIDDQVKIRGYRIELGEIEQALKSHEKVNQGVVIARGLNQGTDKELIAYTRGEATAEELKAYLKEKLPQYMVPSYYVKLEKIPLTSNGKVDRKALPDPEGTGMQQAVYEAPRTETEKQLVRIWSDLIGLKESSISIKSDFFVLGGNSIKAILFLGQIHKLLGVKLDFKEFFANSTIEQLANKTEVPLNQEEYSSMVKISEESDYALSSSQMRLWALSKFDEANAAYNMPYVVSLKGPLNEKVFIYSYNRIISRHEALRTVFTEDNQGNPRQRILSENDTRFFVNELDYCKFETIQKEEYINNFIAQELKTEFNLKDGPLIRCCLLKENENNFILVLVMHHIISDGWSMGVFQEELSELYNAGLEERNPGLRPLDIQYKDYASWHNDKIQFDNSTLLHKQFWIEQFNGQIPVLQLPSDKKRPKNFTYRGMLLRRELDENSTLGLIKFSKEQGGTMFMTLQTALIVLLKKHTSQNDIVIGSPAAGRIHPDLHKQIGFYLGALPIRVQVNNDDTLEGLYQKIKAIDADVLTHQLYPFDYLVKDLEFVRDSSRNPLFDVWLDYHDLEINSDSLFLKEVIQTDYIFTEMSVNTKFDLTFVFHEKNGKLVLNFEYNVDIYSQGQIERLLDNLFSLLANLTSFSENYIRNINILNPNEIRAQLNAPLEISQFNSNLIANSSLSKRFEEVTSIHSENIAIKCSYNVYSYSQINSLANQFAYYLKANYELKDEDIIALKLPRDEWMIIAMLGIMKAGCCYLPIDCKYPDKRINYIINDSKCVAVVDSEVIDHFKIERFVYSKENLLSKPAYNQLAYCIYTSGSTGLPKGVLVEHSSIANTINSQIQHFSIQSIDKTLLLASIAFDASISEIFTTLLSGASLHVIADDLQKDSQYIEKYLKDNYITHLTLTPTLLRNLDVTAISNLKKLVSAGEIADYFVLSDLKRKGLSIINAYGPTEASICAAMFHLVNLTEEHIGVPIGKPLDGTYIILLDENMQLVPYGSIGEICLGGAGLARGYLNRDKLTIEKFIKNPYNQTERIYLTGDLGRLREDGNLEYVGRRDDQVKIRGHRIELGEIEQTIKTFDRIGDCVVIGKKFKKDGEEELIAYITGDAIVDELKTYLKDDLPHYMVPNYYVRLENIPLTSNGKVNRDLLPDPQGTGLSVLDYLPLVADSQKILGQIWSEVLNLSIDKIGLNSDFFALGGDSIKAIQIVAKLRNSNLELKISDVMGQSKLEDMNSQLRPLKRKINQDSVYGSVELNPIQKAFLDNSFARGTQSAKAFYLQSFLLEFQEVINVSDIRKVMEVLISHHDSLRMQFYRNSAGTWEQFNNGNEGEFYILEEITLEVNEDRKLFFELNSIRLKEKLGFTNAPLLGIGLYHDKVNHHTFLLFSIHHLIVDLVSWRILFEDIETLLLQIQKGLPLSLPQKTDSFKFWMEHNFTYGNSHLIEKQREYWKNKIEVPNDRLKVNNPLGLNTFNFLKIANFVLTKEEMNLLYAGMNALNKVEINALLLSALAHSINEVFRLKNIHVMLEGHGREEYIDDIDITRTLGWFTSVFPIILNCEEKNAKTVFEIQDSLNKIPDNGVGYGLLRYLNSNHLEGAKDVQISFNYLGDFTRVEENKNKLFDFSSISHGFDFHPDLERETELEVIGQIQNGVLEMSVQYSSERMEDSVMQQLVNSYKIQLLRISEELVNYNRKLKYPGSFTFKNLSFDNIEKLTSEYGEIQDIYRLSPMQLGLYYHALTEPVSNAYFNQFGCGLKGELDIHKLEQAYRTLIARHGVLRTVFRNDLAEEPIQVVLKEGVVDFRYEDIRDKSVEEQEEYIKQLRESDKDESFDLSVGPLVRLIIIQRSQNSFYQIWSNHHLNLDGWSTNAVLYEFDLLYKSLIADKKVDLQTLEPYSRYIAWLDGIDQKKSRSYWNTYLNGYDSKATLPFDREDVTRSAKYIAKDYDFWLSEELSNNLNAIAQKEKTTLNTIIQSSWGILLSRYNNTQDVVFGSVVSGRPSELKGIQEMIGIFINTVPQRIKYTEQTTFKELLQSTQQSFIAGEPHHHLNLAEIQHESELGGNLIDHLVVFENYPISGQSDASTQDGEVTIEGETVDVFEQMNYDFSLIAAPEDRLFFRMKYNGAKYSEGFIKRLEGQWNQLLEAITKDASLPIIHYDILTQQEKTYLLDTLNATETDYPKDKTIVDLFEEQVSKAPDAIAIKFKDTELSYQELNEKSNQLAHYLKTHYSIQADDLVGIELERSEWMVIGILAIIKSGGAYVPIDPEYPQQRKTFIKEDASLNLTINEEEFTKFRQENKKKVYPTSNPRTNLSPNNLMYVIYTSGSTGNPKGCMLEHGGLVNRLAWMQKSYALTAQDCILQKTIFTFDVSIWELIWWSIQGASVCMLEAGGEKQPEKIISTIASKGVTVMHFVPSMLSVFLEYLATSKESLPSLASLQQVYTSGEALQPEQVKRFKELLPEVKLMNLYGPTEASIDVTYYYCETDNNTSDTDNPIIPIGKPLQNTKVFLMDSTQGLVPYGGIGEICIGGVGLARGYLNREELTKANFITNPYNPNERLYRTGDLGRWREDGNLEYLGRMDNQVKIRGYRIELGEIEQAISTHNKSGQTVVIARAINNETDKELIAYTTGEATAEELKSYLKEKLPSYMVPNYYVHLESIPLTSNGKVDRKGLPDPEGTGLKQGEYVAPRTETEKKLVKIWSEVLRAKEEELGLESDFFALGGDSIKAIQIVARLRNSGYELKISDVMGRSRLQDMAAKLKPLTRKIDQGAVEGEVLLSPIQRAFLTNTFAKGTIAEKQLFHQSFMLCFSGGLNIEETRVIIEKLIAHHDVLRMRYKATVEDEWKQYNGGLQGDYYVLEEVSLPSSIKDKQNKEVFFEEQGNKLKQCIGFKEGPLLGVGLYHDTEVNESHLLLSIHHMVIDLVSWRILFEDIVTLLNQYLKGKKLTLPDKTDSYRYWMEQSKEYAQGHLLERQRTYWEGQQTAKTDTIHVQDTKGKNTFEESKLVGFTLSKEETTLVQQGMNAKNKVETNAVLLAALSRALKNTFGAEQVRILLEGHGREDYLEKTDISRTVGWFTSMYPFVLDGKQSTIESVLLLQDSLTQVPDKGVGYGLLRYLSNEPLPAMEDAQVTFNYLGDFTREERDTTDTATTQTKQVTTNKFSYSEYGHGLDVHLNLTRESELDVSGRSEDGCLQMSIQYSAARMDADQMQELAKHYKAQLLKLSEELIQYDKTLQLPGSFTYKGLSLEQIEKLTADYREIEDIYRLSPMQQGLYYHALSETKSHAYFEQFSYGLKGELDIGNLEQAYRKLITRHGVLRTVFRNDLAGEPLQVVLKEGVIDFRVEDIRDKAPSEQQAYIKALREADKDEGFDLSAGPLVRLIIVQQSENRFYKIWSNHHLILDGWSANAVLYEFDVLYSSLICNQPTSFKNLEPYSRYIAWLDDIDQQKSKTYWKEYLSEYDNKAVLPFDKEDLTQHTGYIAKDYDFWLSEELSNNLNAIAQKEKTTLNTIVQSAWGILLSRYNNTQDVVFGSVVSGRPSELKGIQEMIGILINTVPQRIRYTNQTTFSELLQQTQQSFIAGERYHYMNLAEIQRESGLGTNLIDHLVVFENYPISGQSEATTTEEQPSQKGIVRIEGDTVEVFEQTNYDFILIAAPEGSLFFRMSYNGAKYSEGFIKRLEGQWKQLLGEIAKSTQTSITAYEILTQEEKTYLLETLNDTKADYPKDKTIVDLFEAQVKLTPKNVAIKFKDKELTYRELNEQSNQLAHYLMNNYNIEPDELVGIELERSEWMVVGILAIIKSGGAYVPIDPEYPEQRKVFIKEDANLKLIINEQELNKFRQANKEYPSTNPNIKLSPNNLMYVIYTSGSTGKPKGCMLEHGGLVNRLTTIWNTLAFGNDERILQSTTFTFDVSLSELIMPLVKGASAILLDKNTLLNPKELVSLIHKERITSIHAVPGLLDLLIDDNVYRKDNYKDLRRAVSAGEPLQESLLQDWHHKTGVSLFNYYGPTETSIYVLGYQTDSFDKSVHIGKPLLNTQTFLLDRIHNLVPSGSVGEICIGGVGIARGYLNRPELTAEKFIENPFNKGERLYRTGDLGRWREDGNLEYLGRLDDQVKIRGYRIELGEIEQAISTHKAFGQVVVIARAINYSTDKELIAYTTGEAKAEELKTYLKERLPSYMVPNYYVKLESIPLTSNGKVDRKALPDPEGMGLKQGEYVAPRTETEKKVVKIWSEVLDVEKATLSIKADFFDLGGHSIKAIRILGQIHKQFDVKLALKELFGNPTIEQLGKLISTSTEKEAYATIPMIIEASDYAVSSAQRRLWVLSRFEGANEAYNIPQVLRLEGSLNEQFFVKAYQSLLDRHEVLRTIFTEDAEGHPRQRVLPITDERFKIRIEDYCKEPQDTREENIKQYVSEEVSRGFSLDEGPLIRCSLLKETESSNVWVLVMHHIVSDGWSMGVLHREWSELYNAELEQRPANLQPLSIQYKDYAAWHNAQLQSEEINVHKSYWLEQFKGELPVLVLPSDKPRPKVITYNGASVYREIDKQTIDSLKAFSQQQDGTLFMTLQLALNILLHKHTGQEDIVIGSPIADRGHPDLEGQIGFYVNTLALRNQFSKGDTVSELYEKIKRNTLGAYSHQAFPYDELVRNVKVFRDLTRNPLFDIWLDFQAFPEMEQSCFYGLKKSEFNFHDTTKVKFDLLFSIIETNNKFEIYLMYKSLLFTDNTVESIIDSFIHLLKNLRGFLNEKLIYVVSDIERNTNKRYSVTENKYVKNELKLKKFLK